MSRPLSRKGLLALLVASEYDLPLKAAKQNGLLRPLSEDARNTLAAQIQRGMSPKYDAATNAAVELAIQRGVTPEAFAAIYSQRPSE